MTSTPRLNFVGRKRRWTIFPIIILPLLAALVVRSTMILTLLPNAPSSAAAIWPGPGLALDRSAWLSYLQSGEVDQTDRDMAKQALLRAPNLAEPFLLEALNALRIGDSRGAGRLAIEAARRNPRLAEAHVILVHRLLVAGRVAEALPHIDRAMVLDRQLDDVMMPVLVSLTKSPKTLPPLVTFLGQNPRWRAAFLALLSANHTDPAVIFSLTNAGGEAGPGGNLDRDRKTLIAGLIRTGDFDRAYLAWVNFLPPSMIGKVDRIYDGRFEGFPGLPPFNWSLHSDEMGTAEVAQEGGLRADYFGRDDTIFARQMLLLGPGSYRLATVAAGDMHLENGLIGWRLRCVGGPAKISGDLGLQKVSEKAGIYTLDVAIPATGCPAQMLTLTGTPGEFPKPSHVNITEISIGRLS